MNRKFALLALVFAAISFNTIAGVKVTAVDLQTSGNNGFINVTLDGRSNELPDLKVYGNTIEITLDKADAFTGIFKNVKGAQLSANVLNGKAIVKATLPYSINAEAVNLGWKNTSIEVVFPRGTVSASEKTKTPTPVVAKPAPTPAKVSVVEKRATVAEITKKPSAISKEALNEDYLNKLMNENNAPAKPVEAAKTEEKAAVVAEAKVEAKSETKTEVAPIKYHNKDEVKLQQASVIVPPALPNATTKKEDNFSFAGYAVKFTVFLAMVLGLFYGVIQLLKKGVFNRGKLGFLNNHQMIEVLSTTYVAPKKSLMIVKAHKQLFLVANSENGIQFLSEMKDTSGIIKEGEKAVTGMNFDLNLFSAEKDQNTEAAPQFTLKEDITKSTPVPEETALSKVAVARDIVKFSDELKKKAKKLKPIEFN